MVLREISIIKTLWFNLHYFGIKGLKCPVYVAKNYILQSKGLKGKIFLDKFETGIIRLGFNNVGIFDKKYDRGIFENTGVIHFCGSAHLGHGSKVSNHGFLEFGNMFKISAKAEVICYKKIIFGQEVLISWDTIFMDTNFHEIMPINEKAIEGIQIGNHVWIGCKCVILKGTVIKEGSVIAAQSVVHGKFNEGNVLIGGNSIIIKRGIEWKE